jgi:hypothetical protein
MKNILRKACRPSIFVHGLSIGSPKSKYHSSVSGQLKEYFGGSKEERAIAYALLEVTSPEAALTVNEVT